MKRFKFLLFLACAAIFTGVRLLPYLRTSVPLGYDAGFYLYLFKQYHHLPFFAYSQLSSWLIGQFPPTIAVLSRFLTIFIEPEKLVIPFIIFISILLFLSVYTFSLRFWGKKEALWSVFILSVSALQFQAYSYYYAKQIFASSLLLFIFSCFLKTSYWAIPLSVLLAYTHEPTLMLLMVALLAGFIFEKNKRRYYLLVTFATVFFAGLFYFPLLEKILNLYLIPVSQSLKPASAGGTMFTPSGTFYDWLPALFLSLPYLPFAFWGLKSEYRRKKNAPMLGALAISVLMVAFGLFLNRRFIIYIDLLAVLFAGYGLNLIWKKLATRLLGKLILISYLLFLIGFIMIYVTKTAQSLILDDELQEISKLRETEKNAFVLVTDREYTPWVYGWSDHPAIAPGYGANDLYWTIPQWHEFWESNNREKEKSLLLKLPKPLYLFRGDRSAPGAADFSGPCFQRVNWRTYQFLCRE